MKRFTAIFFFLFLFTGLSFSQKFGIVDSKKILEQMPEYQAVQQEIDQLSQKWQKELEEQYANIKKMYDELKAEEVLLPADIRKQREEDIYAAERVAAEFKKKKFGYDGELYKMQDEKIAPLQEQVYLAISAVATEKKLDIILDKSAGTNILYSAAIFDRTDDVLKRLGVLK